MEFFPHLAAFFPFYRGEAHPLNLLLCEPYLLRFERFMLLARIT
jgi:hypothetical protein